MISNGQFRCNGIYPDGLTGVLLALEGIADCRSDPAWAYGM